MNVGNSERLDILQWLDGYTLVAGEEEPTEPSEDWGSDQFPTDGIMQFDLALQNATPMIAHESKPHVDACRAFRPAFKLLRNCALGSLVINDGGYEADVTYSMTLMLQEFLRRVPVEALTLSRFWSNDFRVLDILPVARGLERLTLEECDGVLITEKLLENLSTFGIVYVDVRFDSLFEIADNAIYTFLLGSNKVCTKSGRRELHLLNVIVSEGFFNTMIETFLSENSSTPVVLAVEGNRIVDVAAFDAIDDEQGSVELYRACSTENSKLINEVYVSY